MSDWQSGYIFGCLMMIPAMFTALYVGFNLGICLEKWDRLRKDDSAHE